MAISTIPIRAIEPASLSLSAQVVPDPPAAAVLVQRAALDQHPEVLLERVAAGPGLLISRIDGGLELGEGENCWSYREIRK